MPFLSVLHGPWGVGLQSILQKFFLYGSLLWLLVDRGLNLALAAAVEMGLLFATSLVQTHIPGRSAEITDTVLAAMSRPMLRVVGGAVVGDVKRRAASEQSACWPKPSHDAR
jgi:hypothetical protein